MPTAPTISKFELARMINQINRLEKRSRVDQMISEEEAAKLLGMTVGGLRNKVYAGEMKGMYSVSPANGARFYDKAKLLGVTE